MSVLQQRLETTRGVARELLVPLLSLVAALALGGLVIVFSDPDVLRYWAAFFRAPLQTITRSFDVVFDAYAALFRGSLGSVRAVSETLLAATPLMLAGLSVALAFRAGLFNIGAEGQILAGSLAAVFVGFAFDLPAVVHLPLALLAGIAGGAVWGFIPGVLKARTGAHEVITTIMLNFIALRLADYFLATETFRRPGRADPISRRVAASAELPQLVGDLRLHAGILIALAAAYGVWWLLFRSTTGFEFRTVGANPKAATYAGMSVGGTYILAMTLAGALAGLGGTANVLGLQRTLTPGFPGYGFDAIALALLGRAHPAGVVLASLLFGVLRAGSVRMQAETAIPVDIIVVIQALVIAFVAAPALVRTLFRVREARTIEEGAFTKSWAQ